MKYFLLWALLKLWRFHVLKLGFYNQFFLTLLMILSIFLYQHGQLQEFVYEKLNPQNIIFLFPCFERAHQKICRKNSQGNQHGIHARFLGILNRDR